MAVDAEGRLIAVVALEIARGQIHAVNALANPDKLRHLGPVADAGAQTAGARTSRP
jgi:hypothetical protein